MNVYGYVPSNYFHSPSALTYWTQAASLVGIPHLDPTFASSGLVFGLKKSHLVAGDGVYKNRNLQPSNSLEDFAPFRLSQGLTPQSRDALAALARSEMPAHIQQHHEHQLQKHQQHQQQNLHHLLFRSSSPLENGLAPLQVLLQSDLSSVGSGLAPLQALCQSDVSVFSSKGSGCADNLRSPTRDKDVLKFGMSRILSDDFGKIKSEKADTSALPTVPSSSSSTTEPCRPLPPMCSCNPMTCSVYVRPPSPYPGRSLPSLTAVHALQPPSYPLSGSADALPGPYSILSTDSSLHNQPKRKRSWSRAVFSNLQRKGLEKRFEVQKYVTKPDRRQLAAMLGLTDAQVKVWFQNRRMKWRHAQQQGDKDKQAPANDQPEVDLSQSDTGANVSTDQSPTRDEAVSESQTPADWPADQEDSTSALDLSEASLCDVDHGATSGFSRPGDSPSSAECNLRLLVAESMPDKVLEQINSVVLRDNSKLELSYSNNNKNSNNATKISVCSANYPVVNRRTDVDVMLTCLRGDENQRSAKLLHEIHKSARDYHDNTNTGSDYSSDVDINSDVDMDDSDDDITDRVLVPSDNGIKIP